MIWGEHTIRYRVADPVGSQQMKVPTYIDRERGLTQWWTRLFLRVEDPCETFPLFESGGFLRWNFQQA